MIVKIGEIGEHMTELKCKVDYHTNKRESHQMQLSIKRSKYSSTLVVGNLNLEDLIAINKSINDFLVMSRVEL